jgi:hypothetical protein
MSKHYTYAPWAKTTEGYTLFVQENMELMCKAEEQLELWENHYHYNLTEAWVDVYDGDQKVNTILYDKRWVPTVKEKIEEPHPELLGKTLRQIVTDSLPSAITDLAQGGVSGCPSDYTLFSREYDCTPNHTLYENRSQDTCTTCWNQVYEGVQKRRKRK